MSWQEISLGELIHIKHGYAFKGEYFSDSGEYVVLTPGNFYEEGGFKLRPGKDRFYLGDIPDNFILQEGDLIVAMTEQMEGLLGSSALIPSGKYLHNQRLGLIEVKDENMADTKYLYYLFNTKPVRHQISSSASGTKVRHTSPERIYRCRVKIPTLNVQTKIADILSAYDDSIENNNRRIELLEQSARLLYREWFVYGRFPGHEHIRVLDGVPEGWEKKKVGELLGKISRKKKIQKADYQESGSIPCIDQSRDFIGGYTDDEEAKILEPLPVIVFGDHTRILKYIDFPFASGADGTQLLVPKENTVSTVFFYFALEAIDLSNYFYARHFKFLKEQELVVPSKHLVEQFTDFAECNMNQVKVLKQSNTKLTHARDLLLPRLMNGEISV